MIPSSPPQDGVALVSLARPSTTRDRHWTDNNDMGKSKNKGSRKRAPNRLEHLNTVPDVLDVVVEPPLARGDPIELRCVSTDTLVDVRIMLSELPETCHVTSFSLRRQAARGDVLRRDLEVVSLKPSRVAMVDKPYTAATAMAHVQRFVDLFTCTNLVGPVAEKRPKPTNSWLSNSTSKQKLSSLTPSKIRSAGTKSGGMWEEPLLDEFYSYFSFSDLPRPVEAVEVSAPTSADGSTGVLVELVVKLAGDKASGDGSGFLMVMGDAEGFHLARESGPWEERYPTIVDLLRKKSKAFESRYAALMAGFRKRNQFGNPPLGLRCNTWVAPPSLSLSQEKRRVLPTEDRDYLGDIGGECHWSRSAMAPNSEDRDWSADLAAAAEMPGNNPAERVVRDRKVFQIWSKFVDQAIVAGVRGDEGTAGSILEIAKRPEEAKLDTGVGSEPCPRREEASLFKGLLADENTIARDVEGLSRVMIHFNGEVIQVKAAAGGAGAGGAGAKVNGGSVAAPLRVDDSIREALNVHGLRKFCFGAEDSGTDRGDALLSDLLESADFGAPSAPHLRWELASSWIEHLKETEKNWPLRQGRLLNGSHSPKTSQKDASAAKRMLIQPSDAGERDLKAALGKEVWEKVEKLNLGLHRKSPASLLEECRKFYLEVALPKIVEDFSSLELSPIDGNTLTEFMHSRGINMRNLGRLAKMCRSLRHIEKLCVQEMVVRAVKRVVRALFASAPTMAQKAAAVAAVLNALFSNEANSDNPSALWTWIRAYVKTRFEFVLSSASVQSDISQQALLRDLCKRCGVEIKSTAKARFQREDIVALFPVVKHLQFASADGKELLESAKQMLDKGKLNEAVLASTSALSKMCAVCGAHSAHAANAFSLLAVVLYHTGDFVQAAIYQAKALAVNERSFGLDHPDTIKSYGDLAVFYYRIGETDLALTYVQRALYLLHMCCGEMHPNTAATYINIAMMEESKGHVGISLRYLQEALRINQRLLGPDHVQTGASYHAIAIALSLMDPPLFSLAVQHEQTCLEILESKLGPDDLRTQDSIAWLDYFDLKAQEGSKAQDCNIASKGHLSVKELMQFLGEEETTQQAQQAEDRASTPDSVLEQEEESRSTHTDDDAGSEALVDEEDEDEDEEMEAREEEEVEEEREEEEERVKAEELQQSMMVAMQEAGWHKVGKKNRRVEPEMNPNAAPFHPVMNPNAAPFHPMIKT